MATFAPRHVDIWPWTAVYGSSHAITRVNASTVLGMGTAGLQASDADDGEYVEWQVALDSGTWTVTVIHYTAANEGIIDFKLDGTTIGSKDCYTLVTTANVVTQFTGVTVATPGVYAFRAQINGKNASSTDYAFFFNLITLTRTGA